MQFTIDSSIKGTQEVVETSIGTIKVGSNVIVSTPQGNRQYAVKEISSRYIKVDGSFMKFDINTLGWNEMGAYATIKIIEVVK